MDFAVAGDNASLAVSARIVGRQSLLRLPAGFISVGGSPWLNWKVTSGMFPLPATLAESSMALHNATPMIFGRIS